MSISQDQISELATLKVGFYELHNDKVRDHHTPDTLFSLADFSEDNGMGELVTEISQADSRTEHPVLFEVPIALYNTMTCSGEDEKK